MAFTTNKLDPLFENNDLKASGTGIYQEVFDNIDYGDQTPEEAVETLLDGMESGWLHHRLSLPLSDSGQNRIFSI